MIYQVCWLIYARLLHPYRDVPGPYLASVSTWWRWYAVRYSVESKLHHALHEKYGPLVRIAPDEISIADPHAIDTISRPDFLKTEFYSTFNPNIGGRPEPFAERNERIHTQHRRIVSPLFRNEAILDYEDYVDGILDIVDERMQMFADSKRIFDLAKYVNRYTWDTVGDMVYSKAGGFGMLRGKDYMGWMEMIRVMPQPMSSLGYVAYGWATLYFVFMLAFSPQTRKGLMSALKVRKQVQELVKERKDQEASGSEFRQNDMLSRMMAMTRDEKVDFNEDDIAVMLNAFVWAGSDTTGSSLSMVRLRAGTTPQICTDHCYQIMYFVLSSPTARKNLLAELRSHYKKTSDLSYTSLSKLPYLTACVNEGMRLHFIVGIGLPRYIPPQGATICGRHFPGNYRLKVLANMQVMQSSTEVFGEDAREFRPERWLDSDEKKVAQMTKFFHPWGFGVRVCIGRFIATMEIYKFLAQAMLTWDFNLVEDDKKGGGKIRVNRGYLQQPSNIMASVKRRVEES